MKKTIAKIAVLAAAILTIGVWTYANSYELPPAPQFAETKAIPEDEIAHAGKFISVDEYGLVRANLYDAALNFLRNHAFSINRETIGFSIQCYRSSSVIINKPLCNLFQ